MGALPAAGDPEQRTVGDMVSGRNASGVNHHTLAFLTPKSGCMAQWEAGNFPVGAFTTQIKALQAAGVDAYDKKVGYAYSKIFNRI
jgi:hypothetical protein